MIKSIHPNIILWFLIGALLLNIIVYVVNKTGIVHSAKELTIESMKYHVKKQFTMGWLIVIPVLFICSLIYFFILD